MNMHRAPDVTPCEESGVEDLEDLTVLEQENELWMTWGIRRKKQTPFNTRQEE
ncbi:MAG: hypothetical protein IKO65_04480 [Victivallales bacterium]|nr:hypothetical protein [Victivallales bacterium]